MIGAAQMKSAAAGSQDTAAMGQHSGIQAFKYFQASPTSLPTVINKYKRRRFQKTKNLLTGETEADPEMIKVSRRRLVSSSCRQTLVWPSDAHLCYLPWEESRDVATAA